MRMINHAELCANLFSCKISPRSSHSPGRVPLLPSHFAHEEAEGLRLILSQCPINYPVIPPQAEQRSH